MKYPSLVLILSMGLIFTASIVSQESFYWEFPESVRVAEGGLFPQIISVDDTLALVWQEFQGDSESLDATISIRASFSEDGVNWSIPTVVTQDVPYLWLKKVPLFSVESDKNGRLVIAVMEGDRGVAVYAQSEKNTTPVFSRITVLPAEEAVADVAISPRLARKPDGSLRVFLTRSVAVSTMSQASTLTIYHSESEDGVQWTTPELFIDPVKDLSINNQILEQNFLPNHLVVGNNEYLVFQTLRQGMKGQVYQLYLKSRIDGGKWGNAVPITENLRPSTGEQDPLLWDNQRPTIGLSADGEILVVWERRRSGEQSNIALAKIDPSGQLVSEVVENVAVNQYSNAFPSLMTQSDQTWILWFDNTGIRLAIRESAYNYNIQSASLDIQTLGMDRASARFPKGVDYNGNPYITWQDQSGGIPRTIILRPDIYIASPTLSSSNFRSGQSNNINTLVVDWTAPLDSSGVLSYSWQWSRDSAAHPSKKEMDQIYGEPRAIFRLPNTEEAEGLWYFSLIAQDQAGNWSEPLRLSYKLDLTPPPPPIVAPLDTDVDGYLTSNTFTISWKDAEKDAAIYYRWRMDYLATLPEELDFAKIDALSLTDANTTESVEPSVSWQNLDDGVWVFSVAAIDMAGNQGLPSTNILQMNRYIPITFITDISVAKDETEQMNLDIIGRGFSVGGLLSEAILDLDGEPPWDYTFSQSSAQLQIQTDRRATVIDIVELERGNYRFGVTHPKRGTVFWNRRIRIESSGSVKFGPFGLYAYESIWEPVAFSLQFSGNQFFILAILLLLGVGIIITITRLAVLARESRIIREDARAILLRQPMRIAAQEEAVQILRRKGMGLRNKFTLALSLLVIFTITMVAGVLGIVWVRMERDALAEGLANESRLLVETLASSAASSISGAARGELLLLPDRISALPDALWATVTGPRSDFTNGILRATGNGSEFIWASNDPDILNKIVLPETIENNTFTSIISGAEAQAREALDVVYPTVSDGRHILSTIAVNEENRPLVAAELRRNNLLPFSPGLGVNRISDVLSTDVELMRQEVEQEVQDAGIARMIGELTALEAEYSERAKEVVLTLDFDNPAYTEAEAAVAAQQKEIETLLLEISSRRFASFPEFNAEALRSSDQDTFIFYKPLLYRVGSQDANFFRGTVRVAVSVDDIRDSLSQVQNRIIIITIIASVASLALGVLVALFIASLIVRPITSLARGVNIIRDQPDMLEHQDFDVSLKTGDELAGLADTINGMVQGLVQAAIEQKELVAGQEIQKTFLPLEESESGKKLSTGGAENPYFRLFGYYEGADAVSGDYFDFRKLDEDHYVMIKLDIAGHGVTASLIMVQIAALYVDYFRRVRNQAAQSGKLNYNLREFTFGINDLINEIGFKGRFAAFNLSVINVRTSEYEMINAGDNLVNIFSGESRTLKVQKLPDGPAAGQIPSDLIEMNPKMYQVVRGSLKRGDILFLYTDGIEEAHHIIRNRNFEAVEYRNLERDIIGADQKMIQPTYEYFTPIERDGEIFETPTVEAMIDAALDDENLRVRENSSLYKQIDATEYREEFDTTRVKAVIEAAMNRGIYNLIRRCDLTIGKPLRFDFTKLEPSGQNSVMALVAVEKVFRIIPDIAGGTHTRVRVDRKVVNFLRSYFTQYSEYYNHPIDEDEGYIYFSHLREDPQDDDLTIWAYERL